VGVDRARRDLGLDAPDIAQQGIAGLDPAAPRQERVQEAKLQCGQAHLGIVDPGAMRVAIDLEPAEPDERRLALDAMHAAQERADAQDQLAHAVRFDDVVVGADLEAHDPIDLLALGGAHHDRDVAGALALAHLATDLGAREIGQHEIEHDHVRKRIRRRAREALATAMSDSDREAFRAQVVLERGGEVDLVLDDQYEHAGALACSS
jgi:hypothetical protein